MTNYIEIRHVETEDDAREHTEWSSTWYAVSPTQGHYRNWEHGEDETEWKPVFGAKSWVLNGSTLTVYSLAEIAALRELLDAVEAEMKK